MIAAIQIPFIKAGPLSQIPQDSVVHLESRKDLFVFLRVLLFLPCEIRVVYKMC